MTGLERPRCPLLDEIHADRALALVGPGRAGTAVALRLSRRGWSVRAVAGRSPDAPSTRRAAALLERLAARIAEVCAVDTRVQRVAVTVRKLHPPVRAMVDHVAVSIERNASGR